MLSDVSQPLTYKFGYGTERMLQESESLMACWRLIAAAEGLAFFLSLYAGHPRKAVSNCEGFIQPSASALIFSRANVQIAFWLLFCSHSRLNATHPCSAGTQIGGFLGFVMKCHLLTSIVMDNIRSVNSL